MDLENNQQKLQVTDEKVEEIEIEENNLEVSSDDSENDMNVNIINNKKGVKLHTIKSKIKVIKYAEVHNISEASRHFGIARKTISDWVHNKTNLLNTPKESLNKTTLHKGKRPESYNIENKLISFIEFNRKLLNPISTTSILIKLLEYAPERKEKSISANVKYIYRFLLRNGFTFRTKTHFGQILKDDCFKQASLFLNEVREIRSKNGINSSIIANMDETPVFLNMPLTKTIVKRGSRQVIIKTQNQEKCRISVLLTIVADGSKLPPMNIFKAKDRANIYNKLQKDQHVINGDCFVECNENAWSTKSIISRWFTLIWNKYLDSEDYMDGMGFLILDKATAHIDEDIIRSQTSDYRFISFIPAGLTRYLQPLDVSVNGPFKKALREKYVNFCIENKAEQIKVSRTNIIDWICSIWNDPNIITKELIYKSFRCTGIANNLDSSEDNLFTAWSHMKEEKPLIENEIMYDIDEEEVVDSDSD